MDVWKNWKGEGWCVNIDGGCIYFNSYGVDEEGWLHFYLGGVETAMFIPSQVEGFLSKISERGLNIPTQ